MSLEINEILSYRQLCNEENQEQLQRGMNYMLNPDYSVVLMSVKPSAPYADSISDDGMTVYYEGHDTPGDRLKLYDQPHKTPTGKLTQNGLFVKAIDNSKSIGAFPLVKVYEKISPGIWTYRGLFDMVDYKVEVRGGRNVFVFTFTVTVQKLDEAKKHLKLKTIDIEQSRQIPGKVKLEVYKRDRGVCVICNSKDNLHFDHILPYSKGGTSLKSSNIRLLCARHNLEKSDKLNYA